MGFEDNKFIFEEEASSRRTWANLLTSDVLPVTGSRHRRSTTNGIRAGHITNGVSRQPRVTDSHARHRLDVVEHITTAETVKFSRDASPARVCRGIANGTCRHVAAEPAAQRGTLTAVPAPANNTLRIGRFGWKAQHASLLSFSGDAYLNEMGITSKFDGFGGRSSTAPDAGTHENPASTAEGVINVTGPPFDPVADPEDDGGDVLAFADFMAATRAPGRQNPIPAAAVRGDPLFNQVGCAVCHTRTFTAQPEPINGGASLSRSFGRQDNSSFRTSRFMT